MSRLKAKILEWLSEAENDAMAGSIALDVSKVEEKSKEPEIYEATAAEINYWHAFSFKVSLQEFLRRYGLDYSGVANIRWYNQFKIGYDERRHAAIFALDDTHYYQIAFDSHDASPLDCVEAEKVMERIRELISESSLTTYLADK